VRLASAMDVSLGSRVGGSLAEDVKSGIAARRAANSG
jgi:hypothetical protein